MVLNKPFNSIVRYNGLIFPLDGSNILLSVGNTRPYIFKHFKNNLCDELFLILCCLVVAFSLYFLFIFLLFYIFFFLV